MTLTVQTRSSRIRIGARRVVARNARSRARAKSRGRSVSAPIASTNHTSANDANLSRGTEIPMEWTAAAPARPLCGGVATYQPREERS